MAATRNTLSLCEAHERMQKKELLPSELLHACRAEADARNAELNIYLELFDDAEEAARAADARTKQGERLGPLDGIPLAVKDNILIKGKRASAASRMLEHYVAPYDATAIARLRAAGAVLMGRTNMDEFAMGSSTESSAFGATRNPRNPAYVPGGSSGGSAASVAAGMALAALGSDTGGSIRQPASFCGVLGFKPSYGRVSRSGLIAMASSLDQIGPLTHTVADAELLYHVLAGYDVADSTTLPTSFGSGTPPQEPLRIGVPHHFFEHGLHPAVAKNIEEQIAQARERGSHIEAVELPSIALALPIYYILMPAEASTNLARFDGVRFGTYRDGASDLWSDYVATRGNGFGAEVKRRIILGTYVLSAGYYDAYYNQACRVRELLRAEFAEVFKKVDVLMLPTTPTPAWRFGEKGSDPLQMYLEDIFTVPANLAGLPALSYPSGESSEGLPLGTQLLAAYGNDELLLKAGKMLYR